MIYQVKEREAELRGEEIGEERGRKAEKIETITSLLDGGLSDDFIAFHTHTPLSEVQALRSKLQK